MADIKSHNPGRPIPDFSKGNDEGNWPETRENAKLLIEEAKKAGEAPPAWVEKFYPGTAETGFKNGQTGESKAKPSGGLTKAQEEAAIEKATEKAIDSGPWAQMSQALVNQYEQAAAPVTAAVSGSTGPAAEKAAASGALASLGLSADSSAGQWLSQQGAAAQASAAPVQAAMSAYGQQYAAEQGPISKALLAYGQANQLEVATAPEQGWLNALASHVNSNLSYQGDIPTADLPALSNNPAVLQALEKSGGYPGSPQSGLTPLSSITFNKQGQVEIPKTATTSATNPLGVTPTAASGGTVPAASTNAGG